ncbi:MAG: Hpt domain-containing protein [Planctomycetota bacterium JB042]
MSEIGLDEDAETVRDVVDQFVETVRSYLETAVAAHGRGDDSALAQAAHKLAGTALTLGAADLGQRAAKLESDVQGGHRSTVDVQIEALIASVARVEAATRSIVAGLS